MHTYIYIHICDMRQRDEWLKGKGTEERSNSRAKETSTEEVDAPCYADALPHRHGHGARVFVVRYGVV